MHLHSLCRHLSGDFTANVVMLLLVVVIAMVLFVASEIWFIVDNSIALFQTDLPVKHGFATQSPGVNSGLY